MGLLHIQFRVRAIAIQNTGDVITALLYFDILMREAQLFLVDAYDRIGINDLCCQQYESLVAGSNGCHISGISGLYAASETAPEINFPRGAGADARS